MKNHILIEGLDRLGKSTLASNLMQRLGYFCKIHYGKPEILAYYPDSVDARKQYQVDSFINMFHMLSNTASRIILDRGHLGEAVYAHRYRGYNGDYIFDLEQGPALTNTLLVLLVNNDRELEGKLIDDGESFDWTKRAHEQSDFIDAFMLSRFKNKMMIDVGDGKGSFISADGIADQVALAFNQRLRY